VLVLLGYQMIDQSAGYEYYDEFSQTNEKYSDARYQLEMYEQ